MFLIDMPSALVVEKEVETPKEEEPKKGDAHQCLFDPRPT